MTAKLIDGKKISETVLAKLYKQVLKMPKRPGLAAILVGDDKASHLYIKRKKEACQKVGIDFHEYLCGNKNSPNITQEEILEMVDWLNRDETIAGIIVQLPLPKKFNTQEIIDRIDPKKDVDGFHPENKDQFLTNPKSPTPPLIAAIKVAIKHSEKNLENLKAVVISNSEIFSTSLDKALEQDEMKVEIISPASRGEPENRKLSQKIKTADILISIVGKQHFIKPEMIKQGAIIIDVGTTLDQDGKLQGDVDPEVKSIASFLTPVPGGIGPLTVAMLLKNIVDMSKPSP